MRKLNHEKNIMLYLIPTIDGILFDKKANVDILIDLIQNENAQYLQIFKGILYLEEQNKIIYDSSARIVSVLLGSLQSDVFA